MGIVGAHVLLYTSEPDALRAVLRDAFGFQHVDAGQGWLIFALPPAELAVHPAEGPTFEAGTRHQLTLMCDDLAQTLERLRTGGIETSSAPRDEGWGITTSLVLPGNVEIMLYEPRHQTAIAPPPPPVPVAQPTGTFVGLIPKNRYALWSYYLGIFSLIPVLGILLGIAAVICGVKGIRYANERPEAKGKAHAWVGIVVGGLFSLGYVALIAMFVAA